MKLSLREGAPSIPKMRTLPSYYRMLESHLTKKTVCGAGSEPIQGKTHCIQRLTQWCTVEWTVRDTEPYTRALILPLAR